MESDESSAEEAEEAEQAQGAARGASARVVLVDAAGCGPAGVARALRCVERALRRDLRAGLHALTALALYNCGPGLVCLLPLAAPGLAALRALRAGHDGHDEHAAHTDHAGPADALWHCSRLLASCGRALGERSALLVTRADRSCAEPARLRAALKRAADLAGVGVALRLAGPDPDPLPPGRLHPHYAELLRAARAPLEPVALTAELARHTSSRSASARLRLHLADGLSVGVGLYHLCRPRAPPAATSLSRDRNEIVSSKVATLKTYDEPGSSETTTVPLLKSELLHYQTYGEERVEFTTDEMSALRNPFGSPTARLLGFKPAALLTKEKWFLERCAFLYPDETAVEGSTRTLSALHRACRERSVVALCMLLSRVNSRPRTVLLAPSVRPLGLEIEFGFDVVRVPYLENVKEVPTAEQDEEVPPLNSVKLEHMKKLLNELSFTYTPDTFENPKLQSLYRAIEALALEESCTDQFNDTTKPPLSKFQNLNGELFQDVFGAFSVSTKRAASSHNESSSKRHHAEQNIDESLLKTRLQTRQVDKYNITELKQLLKWKNPPNLPALTGLKKEVLVQHVYRHFDT